MSILLDFGRPRTVIWERAGVTMDIVPLTTEANVKFVRETTKEVFDGKKFKKMDRDVVLYNQLVGQYCIKAWTGIFTDKDTDVEAECTKENIAKVMLIDAVEDFVLTNVFGLDLVLGKEVEKAKKE